MVTEDLRPAGLAPAAGFAWGYNNAGGLGIGSVARALHPVAVRLPAGTVDVQGGTDFTVALTGTGQVWTWGANQDGQLGTRDTTNRQAPVQVPIPELAGGRVVELIAGGDSVLARTSEHQVYSWGHGGFGQNGNGTTADQTRPQPVPTPAGAAVTGIHTGRYHCLARHS